jgi:dolichol-phosphate mannosyltransferase
MPPTCVSEPVTKEPPAAERPTPLAIVVPCFNEADSASKLRMNLERLNEALPAQYAAEFLLVDDGSGDGTAETLEREFHDFPAARVLRHERNLGIAAAISTGIQAASAGIVCSIDADCSYDPIQLIKMLPLLTDDVAMVVASPYHPLGKVNHVPAWRLKLSKAASGLYRLVLRQKLHTYTSCFRVYRRSAVIDVPLRNGGFVGIAELVCELDRRDERVVESPATLDIRTTGQSKMRVVRAGWAHLKLIGRAGFSRLFGRRGSPVARQLQT